MLTRRNGQVQVVSGSVLGPGASYTINAYPIGAVAASGSSGATITVHPGHGICAGDKILINPGSSQVYSGTDEVQSVTTTTIVMLNSYTISTGDVIFGLGPDTGTAQPAWDGSPVQLFTDPAGAGTHAHSVSSGPDGEYGYWSRATNHWEIIRSGNTVYDYIPGIGGGVPSEINPCDYGCAADGVTDDATRFVVAMSAVGTYGGALVLPAGQILFKSTITIGGGPRFVIRGHGKANVVGDTAASELVKHNTLDGTGILISASDTLLENFTVRGVTGNGGDGITIKSNSVSLKNISVFNMGRDGIRIGDDTSSNSNNWFLNQVVSSSNTRYGVYVHDGSTNANAGTSINLFVQSNGSDGLRICRAVNCTFLGTVSETNSGWGINLLAANPGFATTAPQDNIFVGGDVESDNTSGRVSVDVSCYRNVFLMPHNVTGAVTDGGLSNVVLDGFKMQLPTTAVDAVLNNGTGPAFGSDNECYAVLSGGTAERIRVGWSSKASLPTAGLVPAQVIADANRLYICSRDVASGTVAIHAGSSLVEVLRAYSTGLIVYQPIGLATSNAAQWTQGSNSELITLSTSVAYTESSANLLPANSIIEAVVARVTTTITTAANWSIGDSVTAARFLAATTDLTSGTTKVGTAHQQGSISTDATGPVQAAAAKLRITCDATPGAGAVRVTVFYRQFIPPTS